MVKMKAKNGVLKRYDFDELQSGSLQRQTEGLLTGSHSIRVLVTPLR